MAIAPVLKTGVRKDLGVRIPRPPLDLRRRAIDAVVVLEGFWKVIQTCPYGAGPLPLLGESATTICVFVT